MRRRWLWALGVLLAAGALCLCLWKLAPRPTGASAALLAASEGLDEIDIEARLDVETRSLSVRQTLRLENRTGEAQGAAVLRAWPNAFQSEQLSPCAAEDALYEACYPNGFSMGALLLKNARVNGELVVTRYRDGAQTVLAVPVPGGWAAGARVELTLVYDVLIPQMAYRFGVWEEIYALGNAFVLPAVWEDGAFREDAYTAVGDPFVSDCANYRVAVEVPRGYVCVGSAAAEAREGRYVFEAPAVREFGLVVGKGLRTARAVQDGVTVLACARDGASARRMLAYAKRALRCYGERYGAYAYPVYTVAQTALPMTGMSYPALCMVGGETVQAGGRALDEAIAHETAHQWWYAVVGSDCWNQPWQDEALCEFSLLAYVEACYGPGERREMEATRVEPSLRVTVPHGVTPGSPLSAFGSVSEYTLVVRNRGAACLCALDRTVPDGLDGFLRDYYGRFAFGRATREDFETQLLRSTGQDLTPLLRDYLDTYILSIRKEVERHGLRSPNRRRYSGL